MTYDEMVEIDDDLAIKAREYFKSVGISLEQGAVVFIEEYVKAKGDYESAVRASLERFARIKHVSGDV